MTCKFCHQDKSLIRAHLLPDGLISTITSCKSKTLVKVDLASGASKRKSTLELDSNILCQECDGKLGVFDEELVRFIRSWRSSPIRHQEIDMQANPPTATIKCNSNKLLLSLITILLRFSFSEKYSSLSIGTYENTFVSWLKMGKLPEDSERFFSAITLGYAVEDPEGDGKVDLSRAMKSRPIGGRLNDAHVYMLELPSIFFLARVGKRRWPLESSYYPINKNTHQVEVPCLDFKYSSLIKDEIMEARSNNKRWIKEQGRKRAARHPQNRV